MFVGIAISVGLISRPQEPGSSYFENRNPVVKNPEKSTMLSTLDSCGYVLEKDSARHAVLLLDHIHILVVGEWETV